MSGSTLFHATCEDNDYLKKVRRAQAVVRGFLARTRLKRAIQCYNTIAAEIGDPAIELPKMVRPQPSRAKEQCSSHIATGNAANSAALCELYLRRNDLFFELVWLDQAVKSRVNFLNYKQACTH
ncbi:unnamed protein product [Calicophoron daubneyi]|uniref:Uncharacterized protein n=1 Tax=Calicophoron daubneyi TaxID=300641 RepID=A0AAV2TN47_CALDB